MALDQNIGMVTAYAYAVSKGYTGTEEQFAQELASAGADLSQIQTQIDNFINTIVPAKTAEVTAEGTRQIGLVAAEGTAQKNAVTEEGTTQKNAVISEGTTQKNAVNSAGSTQVNAVNSAGSTQVGNVNTAGSTQVGAVQAKGQEVINSIPSDYTALSDSVEDVKNALNGLADNGEILVWGNVHNYYFGGGPNYATVTPSSATRTMVFPIEDGKKYHIVITGNHSNIGYANEEYETTGDLFNNTADNPYDLYITNTNNFKYLYVYYYNSNQTPVDDPHVDVFTDTELVTNERLNSALAPIEDWYTPVISYDGITDNKYITDTGYIDDSQASCITDYVPIVAGRTYELDGVYLSSSRAVVYFDESKAFIGASDKGSADTTIEITAPTNAAYLRTNGAAGIAPVIKALNHPINADINELDDRVTDIEESISVDNTIDIGTLTSGYVVTYNLYVYTSQTISHSDYIEVIGGTRIAVNNYCSVGADGVAIIVFGADYNGLEIISDGVGGGTIGSITVDLPMSAKYIVINAKPATATPSIVYVYKQYAWSAPINVLNSLESVASKNFMQLFNNATKKPICCIIDDDTLDATDMENFATVLENNGVRGTVACLTKFFESQTGLEAKLHDLERRGHQVVLHGYTQADAYKDAEAFDDANYKLAESDFVKGLTDLKKSGFVDCKYWVTPFGVSQPCMQKLARKWGMKCLITTAKAEYNGTDGKYTRWELRRSGLNPDDTGALTYAQLLALADQCASANGWLLVNTHIYDWTSGYDRINDFIAHCKAQGFEFMTLGEAWEIRKYIYDWYDTF